jgi:ubiquinone/menaquinone biosynthesis C-methylase UbiE
MPPSAKQAFFNQIAEAWDTFPSPEDTPSRLRRLVAEFTDAPASGWILDAGCGTGILRPLLLETHPCPSRLLELDFALDMLRVNRSKTPGRRRVRFLCADVQQLPLRDASFDLVACFGLFPHLPEPETALREFLRVLKPGGVLAIAHLMASHELNAFHATVDGPVAGDYLPPARELAERLAALGATAIRAREEPGFYLVRAARPRS